MYICSLRLNYYDRQHSFGIPFTAVSALYNAQSCVFYKSAKLIYKGKKFHFVFSSSLSLKIYHFHFPSWFSGLNLVFAGRFF